MIFFISHNDKNVKSKGKQKSTNFTTENGKQKAKMSFVKISSHLLF